MELTIYASKKSYEKDGQNKNFYVYSTKIENKKTGEEEFFNVKFKEECGSPAGSKCPMNILIEKQDVNIVEKERSYTDKNGEEKTITEKTIWVSAWKEGTPFVDHSTDDYF